MSAYTILLGGSTGSGKTGWSERLAARVPGLLCLGMDRYYRDLGDLPLGERGRSPESVHEQYTRTVRPMHQAYVWPSGRHADLWITGGQENSASLDAIAAAVQSALTRMALQEE